MSERETGRKRERESVREREREKERKTEREGETERKKKRERKREEKLMIYIIEISQPKNFSINIKMTLQSSNETLKTEKKNLDRKFLNYYLILD